MKHAVIAVLCCLALVAQAADSGKNFFRWTDKDGNVHYGDHLPPEQSLRGGIKYDASGLNKQAIEGAKSAEQLSAEGKLKHLRVEQERLLNEQTDRDQALLRSFRSEEEVRMALQGNLNTLNAQIKVVQANLQRQQEKLAPMQQQVDNLKKAGKAVGKGLAENFDEVQRQVTGYQEQIDKTEQEKAAYAERAEQDVARLNTLKSQQGGSGRALSESAKGSAADLLIGAVPCHDNETCGKAWDAARKYLKKQTTGALSIDTDRILRTAEPASESDVAMILIRISGQNSNTLFLDVRCQRSSVGQALCDGPKSQEMRQGFRNAMVDAMSLKTQ